MQRIIAALLVIIVLGSMYGRALAAAPPPPAQALVIAQETNATPLALFEQNDVAVFARFNTSEGARLLLGVRGSGRAVLNAAALDYTVVDADTTRATYFLAYPMPLGVIRDWSAYGRPLFTDERVALLRTSAAEAQRLTERGVRVVPVPLTAQSVRPAGTAVFPLVTTPDPIVQDMVAQVVQATVQQYTGDLSGEWPVTIGGSAYTIPTRHTNSNTPIQKATQLVSEHLAGLGLAVEEQRWGPATAPNVIGELTGEGQPGNIYMITAHLDDMPSGSLAPGADDNASGAVAVQIASEILSPHRWNCTLRFAFWTGEEQGLLGSANYAQRAKSENENILGVLNLDMIAWNTANSTPEIDLHATSTRPLTVDLANQFASVVNAYGLKLLPEVRADGTGASDHASFWDQGYTAILGIEDYYPGNHDFNPYYHTVNDRLDKLDMAYYTEYVKAAVASMAHMADCRIPGPIVEAHYGDGEVSLHWPAGASDAAYAVRRSTEPYFAAASGTLLTTLYPPFDDPINYTDETSGAHDPLINHFYVVQALNAAEQGASSHRTGEFDFTLTPGG